MAYFIAKASEAVEAYRLLNLTNTDTGALLSIAKAGDTPEFHSTRKLTANENVSVNVAGKKSWQVEAGEAIKEGSFVDVGAGGTVVNATNGEGIGYVTDTVKVGQIANLVLAASSGGKGAKGDKGEPGKSAYQVAVDNGFKGTEQEWLASLKGEKGDKGDRGLKGDKGDPGATQFTEEEVTKLKELIQPGE